MESYDKNAFTIYEISNMDNDWEKVYCTHYHHWRVEISNLEDKKDEMGWNEMKMDCLNVKAMNPLVCALSFNEFNRMRTNG